MAEYYSAELSQKILRGLKESLRKGNYCGGQLPYGYKVIDKKVYIDEQQAEVINYIFSEYSKGKSVGQIISALNAKGITNKDNKPFKNTGVYHILRNPKYIGLFHIKGEVYENIYPQIVDDAMFQRVQQRLANNKSGKSSTKATYLLRDKLKCGYCGMPISAECGTSHTGEKKYYYKCLGIKKYRNGCQKKPIRKDVLENLVMDCIMRILQNEEYIEKIVNGMYDAQMQQQQNHSTLQYWQQELKTVENALQNVMKAIEQGIITPTTRQRLSELEQQKQDIEQKIAVENAKSVVIVSKKEIRNYYTEALKLEPQVLINYVVKEIVLYNDQIEIVYNSPLQTISPDDSQGFSFYTEQTEIEIYMGNKFDYDRYPIKITMKVK